MNTFRKGDVVTVHGTIDSDHDHDGKIRVRIEPYSDVYVNLSDLKMVRPVINVGDSVTYPAEGYRAGEVLAVIDGYCWVKLPAAENPFSPPGEGIADGMRVSWPLACINRVDSEPAPADAERIDAPPPFEATIGLDTAEAEPF